MIKVVIIGPESTGKSTLTTALAHHYETQWVPEFAREFLQLNGMNYNFNDLLSIARGQIEKEEAITGKLQKNLVFIDTNMYVMKVWCEFVFHKCHNWINQQLENRHYDLYLLCNTDLPWVQDDLREYPDLETREQLYNMYQQLMINQDTPWVDIRGSFEQRLATAVKAVDKLLVEKKLDLSSC